MSRRVHKASFLACFAATLVLCPRAAAQTPSPALLVLEKTDKQMAIVDPSAAKVVGRVSVGDDPHEVAVSSDGKLAFVSNYGGPQSTLKTIAVVVLASQKSLPPVDLGALHGAHGLAFSNGKLYFTAEVNKVIGSVDPGSDQVDWILGTGQNRTHMLVVTKDLSHIFTSNIGSNSISAIDHTGKDWKETVIPVGRGPEGFDVSPDGGELWAANSQDGTISIVNLATRRVTETLRVHTARSNRLKFTPDGKLVLVSDLGNGDLLVLDRATRRQVKRIKLGRGAAGILIVPDGSRAYVAVSPDNNVAVIDLKTQAVTGRISTGNGPDGLAWVEQR